MKQINFNSPLVIGQELDNIAEVVEKRKFSGCGAYTEKCSRILENIIGCKKAVLTPSCTAALEMCALLCDLVPGDEVIMPSFTFVSTASAFALRGAKIVWCDIREDTKNIDEQLIEELITDKTKAVVLTHYAGVSCEMNTIVDLCKEYNLFLIEDAAQAIGSTYHGKPLGSFGDLATLSFHETKNIQCGEGGTLLVNNLEMVDRAQFIRDKGTNRIDFSKGKVDKYTWVELGSSFLMSEFQAAFLSAQLEKVDNVNENRRKIFNYYFKQLEPALSENALPVIPKGCEHNGQMFYIVSNNLKERDELLLHLKNKGIMAVFHYPPLHKAPFWKGLYDNVKLDVTEHVSDSLLRLPVYFNLEMENVKYVSKQIIKFCR